MSWYLAFKTKASLNTWTTDAQWSLFSLKSITFGLGQTNWANKFWGIWGIFCRTMYQHPFWYSESLVHVFHYSIIIFTKNWAFISTSQTFFGGWDLNLGCKELVLVRSPWLKMTTIMVQIFVGIPWHFLCWRIA
jgi:hypothetical protein